MLEGAFDALYAAASIVRSWRRPSFSDGRRLDGKSRNSAVLQYARLKTQGSYHTTLRWMQDKTAFGLAWLELTK